MAGAAQVRGDLAGDQLAVGHDEDLEAGHAPTLGASSRVDKRNRARAALIYGDVSRDLVLSLKYQGRRDGLFVLGGWMANAGKELLADADLIVPVPLHDIRLVRRGFNQSAWLAAELSRQGGVKLSVDALKRVKRTPHPGRPLRRRPAAECPGRIPCPEVPGETGEGSENLAGR